MVAGGEVGEVRTDRGVHAEDHMADAALPWSFRSDPAGGGILADLGSHALATAGFLTGPIARVLGDLATAIPERSDGRGGVDDVARAVLRSEGGATGSPEASWVATGRKMRHDREAYGTEGALGFTQQRPNELHLCRADDPEGRRGSRRIEAGPAHPP